MKKNVFIILLSFISFFAFSQGKGVKIGYIDMEYILEKVPNYADAKNQLDQKAQVWKKEMETKKNEIDKLKENLKNEKALLTKELIEEREEEINFLESELLEYQQKRFGPKGDLAIQKATLVKPIQDQVFTIVQDMAVLKKYDFVFDKSSDLTMLFAAQRFDLSDLVVRQLMRAEKREEMTAKQLKVLEAKEALEDLVDGNPEQAERQKALDAKKAKRDSLMDVRKKLMEEKRQKAQDRKEELKAEREAKKNGTVIEKKTATDKETNNSVPEKTEAAAKAEETREAKKKEREKLLADKKAALEARKKEMEEKREAAKKAREEKLKEIEEKKNKPKEN